MITDSSDVLRCLTTILSFFVRDFGACANGQKAVSDGRFECNYCYI